MSERVQRELVCDACGFVAGEGVDMLSLCVVVVSGEYVGMRSGTDRHVCSTQCAVRLLARHHGPAAKHPLPDAARGSATSR